MRTIIHCNFDLCTGCSICQMACSQTKTGGTNPRLALISLKKHGLIIQPVVCAQCQNAFCMQVCPIEAIHRDSNGTVIINEEKCSGCGLCAEACQIGMVLFDRKKKVARKCDLCDGDPECVKYCPTGALEKIVLGGEADV